MCNCFAFEYLLMLNIIVHTGNRTVGFEVAVVVYRLPVHHHPVRWLIKSQIRG